MSGSGGLSALARRKADGGKLLVPYVTGMYGPGWLDLVGGLAAAGADAIEVGLPFSDPAMDGPTIQEASTRALAGGATPAAILDGLARLDVDVPLVAMTYFNLVHRAGPARFAGMLAAAGVSGAIIPDLPLEESSGWEAAAAQAGVDPVLLAAPVSPDERLAEIGARSRGFVYAVSTMGVTGARDRLDPAAIDLVRRLRPVTDLPVLLGFGISGPGPAAQACTEADGVVMASALMRLVLDGEPLDAAVDLVSEVRKVLDSGGI